MKAETKSTWMALAFMALTAIIAVVFNSLMQ
jgi:hypothetical protein